MARPCVKKLDLEIEIDVLTSGMLAEVVNSILEFLLYQRNQIEFVYRTFRGFVNEWVCDHSEAIAGASLNSYMMHRQREKAIQTKQSISAMRELIFNAFDKHLVRSLRFLFGSTTLTPKEVYTIHVPMVNAFHLHDHHQLPRTRLNQLLLSLLTMEDLYSVFSKNLCPTNLYLELEIFENASTPLSDSILSRLHPKKIGKLPSSCKDIHLHLRQKLPVGFQKAVLNCCKEISVFEELLHMESSTVQSSREANLPLNEFNTNWFEAGVIVRGFKEKIVKGKSIWTK